MLDEVGVALENVIDIILSNADDRIVIIIKGVSTPAEASGFQLILNNLILNDPQLDAGGVTMIAAASSVGFTDVSGYAIDPSSGELMSLLQFCDGTEASGSECIPGRESEFSTITNTISTTTTSSMKLSKGKKKSAKSDLSSLISESINKRAKEMKGKSKSSKSSAVKSSVVMGKAAKKKGNHKKSGSHQKRQAAKTLHPEYLQIGVILVAVLGLLFALRKTVELKVQNN